DGATTCDGDRGPLGFTYRVIDGIEKLGDHGFDPCCVDLLHGATKKREPTLQVLELSVAVLPYEFDTLEVMPGLGCRIRFKRADRHFGSELPIDGCDEINEVDVETKALLAKPAVGLIASGQPRADSDAREGTDRGDD